MMHIAPPSRGSGTITSGVLDDAEAPRVYQAWKGSNIFFLQGRFIFGPDASSLFLTIFLIVAPVSIFCVFVARKLMDDFSHNLGISIMIVAVVFTLYDLSLLLVTSGRDPGIIPRNTHPPEPETNGGDSEVGGVQTPQLRLPRTKDVIVNGITVKIKYCDTCMLYRPPRCSHCSICNNCVERFDHHCPWVGQCIGIRNYRFFYMFVFSTTLLCLYVFGFCWVYIISIRDAEQTSIWRAMVKTPASIVLIIYTFLSVWFVGGLSIFHLYLMSTNQTTYENFRYRYDRRANPYNKGVVENFKEIFFTSIPPSKNNFRGRVPQEQGLQPQPAGQGFLSPNMGKALGDIEMGRKPISWDEARALAHVGDLEEGITDTKMLDAMNGGLGVLSPDLSKEALPPEAVVGRTPLHTMHSSYTGMLDDMNDRLDVVSSDLRKEALSPEAVVGRTPLHPMHSSYTKTLDDINDGLDVVSPELRKEAVVRRTPFHPSYSGYTKMLDDMHGVLHDMSPDLSKEALPSEAVLERTALHPRHLSWVRRSGSWEMTPEVLALAAGLGESKRKENGSGTSAGNK
ncbi:unnamed protein product [Musa acuminata subsp. burmannicoides]